VKIAAITNSRIPSLTANSLQAMKVCDALREAGHDLHLFAPREADPAGWERLAAHYGLSHPFEVTWLPSLRMARRYDFIWYAQAAAGRSGAELIYTWLPQSAAIGLRRGFPVVLEMHADVAGRLGAWWLRQFWARPGRKRMLATTKALRAALERSTGLAFPEDGVQIAPNGVDLDRYANLPDAPEARRRLGLVDGPTAGFTGHFYAGRGMDLLFDLARTVTAVQFIWAGGTSGAVAEWRGKLQAAGVSNVTLPGFIENSRLPLYQAAADVLLMPYGRSISASSGQDIAGVINPMKMFEYMAAGRAIISSDLPVIREVLDETRAVFCEPDDLPGWTAALGALLADSDRRRELAANARTEVQKYTWQARARRALQGMQ
jgi:glycosyltransferase involved in cell wall biosynthesis